MGIFDQASRFATFAEPIAPLKRLCRDFSLRIQFREWIDSRTTPLPGDRDRTADRVAAVSDGDTSQLWILLQEFQAQENADKLEITLIEAAQLRSEFRYGPNRDQKYRVMTALIYLRGRCPETVLDMTGGSNFGTRHAPMIWNIADDSAEEWLHNVESGEISWGMFFWIALMSGADNPSIIDRWKSAVDRIPDRSMQANLVSIALVFADLAGYYAIWKQKLEEWQMMTESPVVNAWIEQASAEHRIEIWTCLCVGGSINAVRIDSAGGCRNHPTATKYRNVTRLESRSICR